MNKKNKKEIVVILHDIRSSYNVGSVFRTAEAAGVAKIFLTGITPLPVDRFGRVQKEIAKTALGAEKMVLWEHVLHINKVIADLKKSDFYIVAIEQAKNAQEYTKMKPKRKTAFIFGNETKGLMSAVLGKSDMVLEIPMRGKKESLNVSVAAGIILYHFVN